MARGRSRVDTRPAVRAPSPSARSGLSAVVTPAILFAAALLFMVQPLVGKVVLPVLGGSPAVWSICLVFFQSLLFLGYLYAHLLTAVVRDHRQPFVHVAVLAAACLTLPLATVVGEPGTSDARWWALGTLLRTVGLPVAALAATAPLLQRWFSRTNAPGAADPYFFYATSNVGSMLGLLAFPVLEPFVATSRLAGLWSLGFWMTAALIAGGAFGCLRFLAPLARVVGRPAPPKTPDRSTALLWIALAAVPSALLAGVTQHIATDIVSMPLLWVVPLGIYLLTFIAAFSPRGAGTSRLWGTVAPVPALLTLAWWLGEMRYPIVLVVLLHLATFGVLSLMCHVRLAEARPDPAHLTRYYLCISAGGALGGAVVALAAPAAFSAILEYPLALGAALLLRPQAFGLDRGSASWLPPWRWLLVTLVLSATAWAAVSMFDAQANLERPDASGIVAQVQSFIATDAESVRRIARALFIVPAVALWLVPRTTLLFTGAAAGLFLGAASVRTGGDTLHRERTFFGVHQVTSIQGGAWHVLTHGTTTHGIQATGTRTRLLPTAYYHPTGPFGDLVFTLSGDDRFRDVAVVGLGAGALAGYVGGRTRMDFFEIDPAVVRIAENPQYFTYLADARARPGATIRTHVSDGRVAIRTAPASSYDVIVIDAFTSDAIPTHLMTREAIALYASRLKPRGVMAFHVSNRFFDLQPVLARLAGDQRLIAYGRDDLTVPPERAAEGRRPSTWVLLARNLTDLGQIASTEGRWQRLPVRTDQPVWTDDHTSALRALVAF